MCAMRLFWLERGVDAAGTVLERPAGAPGTTGDDLREDREGDFGRRRGADVEPGRARDAVDRLCLHARFEEELAPSLLIAPRAERTDVERIRLECALERGDVEAVLVREHDDGGVLVGPDAREGLVGPFDEQLVGARHALGGCEPAARVSDDRRPAELLRGGAQGFRGVDRADDEQPRRRAELVDERPAVIVDDRRPREPLAPFDALGELRQLGQCDLLDEHVDLAAAGQADRPGLLVRDSVGTKPRRAAGEDRPRLLDDLALDAASRDRARELALRGDREFRSDRPRGRSARRNDGGESGAFVPPLAPAADVADDLLHGAEPTGAPGPERRSISPRPVRANCRWCPSLPRLPSASSAARRAAGTRQRLR